MQNWPKNQHDFKCYTIYIRWFVSIQFVAFRSVAVSVCGRFGFWPFHFLAVMTRNHQSYPSSRRQMASVGLHDVKHINCSKIILRTAMCVYGEWFKETGEVYWIRVFANPCVVYNLKICICKFLVNQSHPPTHFTAYFYIHMRAK